MFRIIQKRNYLFAVSTLLLIPGVVALSLWGLKLGIDFTGGSLIVVDLPSRPAVEEVRAALTQAGVSEAIIQSSGQSSYVLRLPYLSNDQHQAIQQALQKTFAQASEQSYETIGPTIGRELKQRAVLALSAVLAAIILYITWAFRRVSRGPVPSWVYGASAFLALVHDVLMVLGAFAFLGHFLRIEVDSLFVTALLTVLGFSVHDTIVVFDRIRERLRVSAERTYEGVVNESLNQTLVRSLNTSLTTVIVLVALLLFGGDSIRLFVLALVIGIISGTYSSIFVASPLLVVYERWRHR